MNELGRIAGWPACRLYFAWHGVAWGSGWSIYGRPILQRHQGSRIVIGNDFEMRNGPASSPLGVDHACLLTTWSAGAVLEIGRGVGVTGGAICAERLIHIGDDVTIGANCTITDTDFHPLEADRRQTLPSRGAAAPVIIEDGVFLGMRVTILKGSHIGRGSVLGAGSVVAGEIPAHVVAAGNPARVIHEA